MHMFGPTNNSSPFVAAKGTAMPQAAAVSASDAGSAPSSNPRTSTATITANDFLQLLVTELKNQDPTANTDPNEYVDQLVQVNSLQQEIQMNQTLDGGPTLTGSSSGVLQELAQMNSTLSGDLATTPSSGASSPAAVDTAKLPANGRGREAALVGNQNAVSNPATQASAETVANALTANSHQAAPGLHIPSSQMGTFAEFAARLRANRVGEARP